VARPKKYPDELIQRGIRLAMESERPIAHIAADLGMHPETLRKKVRQAEADSGRRGDLLSTQQREEIGRLRKENYELRRAKEILKLAYMRSGSPVPLEGGRHVPPPASPHGFIAASGPRMRLSKHRRRAASGSLTPEPTGRPRARDPTAFVESLLRTRIGALAGVAPTCTRNSARPQESSTCRCLGETAIGKTARARMRPRAAPSAGAGATP
jgi:transposase